MSDGVIQKASRDAIASGGLLKHANNLFVVREAIEILTSFRATVDAFGFNKDCYAPQKLYGQNQDGGIPQGLRLHYENFAKMIELFEKYHNGLNDDTSQSETSKDYTSNDAECRKEMVGLMDDEIERLTELEKRLKANEMMRAQYKTSVAVIPGQEVSDRLIRCEGHLSREIDRILNRLERLQRIRKGQPLPPQLDVNIT